MVYRRVGQRSTTPLLAELQPPDDALLAIENIADVLADPSTRRTAAR